MGVEEEVIVWRAICSSATCFELLVFRCILLVYESVFEKMVFLMADILGGKLKLYNCFLPIPVF